MNRATLALAAIVAISAGAVPRAQAVDALRDYYSHGVANCQAALPIFDGNIRKRPLGLSNESTANAFVTCDNDVLKVAPSISLVEIQFTNRDTVAHQVTCTLVTGFSPTIPSEFFVKSTQTLSPNGVGSISWTPLDNEGDGYRGPAASCNLPPGVEINTHHITYTENVGN